MIRKVSLSVRDSSRPATSKDPADLNQAGLPALQKTVCPSRLRAIVGVAIFFSLLGVYHVNSDVLPGNDAKPNLYLAANVLEHGCLSFSTRQMPFMFTWRIGPADRPAGWCGFDDWSDLATESTTYRQLLQRGLLGNPQPKYYLTPSVRKSADGEGIYVNTFGPGSGLTALPVLGLLHLAEGSLLDRPSLLWYGGKFAAAALVAGSAVFVFLAAGRFLNLSASLAVVLAYGLGTCVWSISSQSLWQHGPNNFFLSMGIYFLIRTKEHWRYAALMGLALSAAVACRPTSAIAVLAVGLYLLIANRRALLPYVLAGLPIAALLGAYNTYYLGKAWRFGQAEAGLSVAANKTGSPELWQTPLWLGAGGLLASPSRGLLVFSPVMVLALGGTAVVLRDRRWGAFWPVVIMTAGLWVIAFKWFDWWGGWCFGYRPIVDTMPMLAVLMIPVADWIFRRKTLLAISAVLLGWSIGVQVLGSFAYDVIGWNNLVSGWEVYLPSQRIPAIIYDRKQYEMIIATRPVDRAEPINLDIDNPDNRHRLWSISDSQLIYLIRNFRQARLDKKQQIEMFLKHPRS